MIRTESQVFISVLYMAVLAQKWQSWVAATLPSAKPKVFPIWPCREKVCQLVCTKLNSFHQNSCPPGSRECDFILKQGLCRHNQVKRILYQGICNMADSLLRTGKSGHRDTDTQQRTSCEDEAEIQ